MTSRYGVMLRVLRESPTLAGALGLSPSPAGVTAFALGAFPAGMAGCLFGYISLVVTPGEFTLTLAIAVIAASLLGGAESVYGAVLGAAILQLGPEHSLSFEQYAPIAYGLFLVLVAVTFRSGLSGLGHAGARRLTRWVVRPGEGSRGTRCSPPFGIIDLPPLQGAPITVSALSKAFAGAAALDHVTLSARPGEITAVIGANGSGKTTLLNVISGFCAPDGRARSRGRHGHHQPCAGCDRARRDRADLPGVDRAAWSDGPGRRRGRPLRPPPAGGSGVHAPAAEVSPRASADRVRPLDARHRRLWAIGLRSPPRVSRSGPGE